MKMRYSRYFKIIIAAIVVGLLSICIIYIFNIFARFYFDIEKPYVATITNVEKGSLLTLDNGKKVVLAGVHLPFREKDANYNPMLLKNLEKFLIKKQVTVHLVERQRSGSFNNYDLVRIYSNDNGNLNEFVLKNGMAFFDHSYYRNKEKEYGAEQYAKNNNLGLWANKDKLTLLYVGDVRLKYIHYPECPEAKKIKEKNKMEYYFTPTYIHFFRAPTPRHCSFCDEIRKTKPKELQ